MGETKRAQKQTKQQLDDKLRLAQPSRQILEDLAVACAKDPSPDNTFQYAFCLSKSSEPSELRYAVTILDGLVKEGYEHQVDCMYGAAVALYLLEDYDAAQNRCESILRSRPESRTTSELHLACIEAREVKEREETKKVVTGVGAAVAIGLAAGVASLFLKR